MENPTDYKTAKSIYDFTVQDSFGNDVKLDKYKGHVVLIVNIASQCGLAKTNYAKLTELKNKYDEAGKFFFFIAHFQTQRKIQIQIFIFRFTHPIVPVQSVRQSDA